VNIRKMLHIKASDLCLKYSNDIDRSVNSAYYYAPDKHRWQLVVREHGLKGELHRPIPEQWGAGFGEVFDEADQLVVVGLVERDR
jgi:hypothetical protein